MRLLVTGDREWKDRKAIERAFDQFKPTSIIEGECRGLDLMARAVAEERGIPVTPVPAKWEAFGKAAGHIRNGEMLDLGPDLVLAFHNDFKKSKGTKNCVDQALKRELEAWLVTSEHILRLGKKKSR
jgi:hypothetical protein